MKKTIVCLMAALAWVLPTDLPSCPMMFPSATFVLTSNPAKDSDAIAAGKLGIIQPTWRRRYLVVSYRYLSGRPLTPLERKAFAETEEKPDAPNGSEVWRGARVQVTKAEITYIRQERDIPKIYQSYLNCTNDAFTSATRRLEELIKQYGKESALVKDWVAAQDVVFSNCSEGQNIPQPTTGPLAADRAYQIAAACFYGEKYDEARTRFQEIAHDERSPWRDIAPYLAARALIRKATVAESNDFGLLEEADRELRDLQRDPTRPSIHEAAHDLSRFTAARLHQTEFLEEVTAGLSDPKQEKHFGRNLEDFLYIMDRLGGEIDDLGEMIRWIRLVQGKVDHGADMAMEQWERTHALQWLVAAMVNIGPKDPRAAQLIEAAKAIPADSPGYPTVTALRVPMEVEAGRGDAVREEMDRLLPGVRKDWPVGSVNQFLRLRMAMARSLDEMLRFAARTPAGTFTWGENDTNEAKETRDFFDSDAARILDGGVPLRMLVDAARNPQVPVHLRRRMTVVAFARALVLDDRAIAQNLLPDMRRDFPGLDRLLSVYARASTPEGRRFDGAYLLLQNPGMQFDVPEGNDRRMDMPLDEMDEFRDNWWSGWAANSKPAPAPFLTAAEQEEFAREWSARSKVPAAPTALGHIAIEWARTHPGDPRSPEALHLTVRATRLGMGDGDSGAVSKAAFELLHRKWPKSEAARLTPYWFQ